MADKYIANSSGSLTEVQGLVTSTGAPDAGKIVALDGTGHLDQSLMPVGLLPDTASIVIEDAGGLAAGDFVNVFDNAGTPKVRKADASNNRPAVGFVAAAYADAATALVYFEGTNSNLTGLTIGATYFLSDTTAGGATSTAPTTATYILQVLGKAISATKISFEGSDPITLA